MQAEIKDPYKLSLRDPNVQDMVYSDLCRIAEEVTRACSDRDSNMRMLRWQLEGYSQPNINQPWPGACQVESTMSRELHTTLTAALWSSAKQFPYCTIEAVYPDDLDKASSTETYLNLKAQQFGYEKALYDCIYLALEGRYSVMYQCADQKVMRYFELDRKPEEVGELGEPETESESTDEPTVNLKEEPKDFCIKFRVPDPWDFYTYPVNARGPQEDDGCLLTLERMYLTREDLSLGVLYEGFDQKAVQSMIRQGPAQLSTGKVEERDEEFQNDGLDTTSATTARDSGMWECFQVIGRMPWACDDDGNPQIPQNLLHVDCLWMICPALNLCFKQAYSPAPEGVRPYTVFNVIDKPNRMLGDGICSIISPLHEEATAITRFGINNMNLEASPVMTVAESWLTRYNKWTIAPGRFMPRQSGDPVGPRPLVWDVRSQQIIMPWLEWLDAQASRLAASQGANAALAGKVRKAAEVHFAEGMQETKFDLFLSNIQRGVVKSFEIMRRLLVQHMEESDTAFSAGKSITVEPNTIDGEYRFFAQAASDSLTPAARLAKQKAVAEIVTAYWMQVPQWLQLGCLNYMWHLTHRLLVLADERSPERYIGPEPPSAQQMQDAQQEQMGQMGQAGPAPLGLPAGMGAGPMAQPGLVPAQMGAPQGAGVGMVPQFNPEGAEGAGMLQASALSPRNGAY